MAILGKNIIFTLDGKHVAGCTNCEITLDYSTIEVANPTDGKAKKYIFDRYGWSMLTSHIIPSLSFAVEELFGKSLNITIGELEGEGFHGRYSGEVLCINSKVTANNHSIAKGAFSFLGNGALTKINQ